MADLPGDPGASPTSGGLLHLLDRIDHLLSRIGEKIPAAGRLLAHFHLSSRGMLLAFAGLALLIVLPPLLLVVLRRTGLTAKNYRGEKIPQSFGILVLLWAATLFGLRSWLYPETVSDNDNWLLILVGFGCLGLLDDVRGTREHKGLGGHFRALMQGGKITTGLIKAIGGVGIALWVGHRAHPGHPLHALLTAALIALFANAINLLDLRPGRAAAGFLLAGMLLMLSQMRRFGGEGFPLLVFVVIPTFVLWERDSRARVMMGDVGSNLLGACLGFAASGLPTPLGLMLLGGLIALHVYAERVSLTEVIERSAFLRLLDACTGVRGQDRGVQRPMDLTKTSRVHIRQAKREDSKVVLGLIEALAHFEELAPPDEAARNRLMNDGWPEDGRSPRFLVWLAELEEGVNGEHIPAGYAITLETYSSFLARPTLYLEDLFILPAYRRRAAGSAMMEHLIQFAREQGCGRMEWVVLDWNTNAQKFYQRLGGVHLANWQTYRLRLDP